MITVFSWFLIPWAALLMSGRTGWLTTNFSVTASTAPGCYYLILWASFTGGFFRYAIKRITGQASFLLSAQRELALTDLAVILLMISVFLPYAPDKNRGIACLHVVFAFTATVLFYLIITSLNLKLYFRFPKDFSLTTGLLILAIGITAALLILTGFLISSALELFLTVFAGIWLHLFYRRVKRLSELKLLELKKGV